MPPVIYLIDGHALAYRVFFALTSAGSDRWQTKSGEPTAGVYGFASVLIRMLEQDKPEYLAVAFDTGKTFRDELFPEYKATRAKMPDDLRSQMERIRQMVDAFGLPRLEMEGFEADDVLGSMAVQAVESGFGVKIITGDRDLLQLVNDRVIVNLAGSKLSEAKDYTAREVYDYLGVWPQQVVDYKALVGDTSDNIPGVAGVGEKTATGLLSQYPTLDEIYAHLGELPQRVRTRLEAGQDSAHLSRTLASIRTDLHLTLDLEKARTDAIDYRRVEDLFRELEFKTLIVRLRQLARPAVPPGGERQPSLFAGEISRVGVPPPSQTELMLVNSTEALQGLVQALRSAAVFALDTETTSTDPMRADLVGISLAVREGEGYYIPVGHHTTEPQLPVRDVLEALKPFLADPEKVRVGHNGKYDALVLARHGLAMPVFSFDTMVAEWCADPGSRQLGLKDMADNYLNVTMTHIEELIGRGKNQRSMAEVTVESAAPYAAADADMTLRLKPLLEQRLKERSAESLFYSIEMPLIPVLAMMEQNGVALDLPFFSQMAAELSGRMGEIEATIYTSTGQTFNINSTQQLSDVLFKTLRLQPPGKKTASGKFSTAADVLEDLRGVHPVVDMVLEYRELAKLKSTYVEALPLQVNPLTGRVHTSFNQTGSVTGRLASSEPNLQNIPTRTDLGRRVRQGFIASEGHRLLSVDYSQVELRIVAHMSEDKAMLDAFRAGLDIHAATAAAVYGVELDQVSKDMRRNAKAINFGLIYGMSAFGLSRTTGLTLGEAENFVKAYFQRFTGVKKYLDGIRLLAARQGYVETLLGRRRYFPNLQNQQNVNLRLREEREAINAPIQGTAADILKIAMIRLPAELDKMGLRGRLLLQVHDELVLEVPLAEVTPTARAVQKVMENAYQLSIPLLTEARSGQNWGSMQVLDLRRD